MSPRSKENRSPEKCSNLSRNGDTGPRPAGSICRRSWSSKWPNSDWYRTNFYSDAQDGWYAGTGGTLHAGAKGGMTIGRVEVVLRAGVTRTETLNNLDLPFYGTLGANVRF